MTVSKYRTLDMEQLSSFLDALPDARQYFLVYCCDDPTFKVTGNLQTSHGRLSRLSILRLNMQPVGQTATAQEVALKAAVAAVAAETAAPAPAGKAATGRKRGPPSKPVVAAPGSQPADVEAAAPDPGGRRLRPRKTQGGSPR